MNLSGTSLFALVQNDELAEVLIEKYPDHVEFWVEFMMYRLKVLEEFFRFPLFERLPEETRLSISLNILT